MSLIKSIYKELRGASNSAKKTYLHKDNKEEDLLPNFEYIDEPIKNLPMNTHNMDEHLPDKFK